MNYQALGNNVLLELPYEARWIKGYRGEPDIKKEGKVDARGKKLTVLSVGENVTKVKEGDQVLLFLKTITVVELDEVEYVLVNDYEIDFKVKEVKEQILFNETVLDSDILDHK